MGLLGGIVCNGHPLFPPLKDRPAPLPPPGPAQVLEDTSQFDDKDQTVVRDLKDFSAASICRTRRVSHLRDLYGEKTWTMGPAEWREIQANTCIYTSRILPRQFFVRLVGVLSADANAQYWKEQSHQSLNNIWHMVNMTVPEKVRGPRRPCAVSRGRQRRLWAGVRGGGGMFVAL